jgi:hypothetical protein
VEVSAVPSPRDRLPVNLIVERIEALARSLPLEPDELQHALETVVPEAFASPPPPPVPTDTLPGSPERAAVMAARADAGTALRHPADVDDGAALDRAIKVVRGPGNFAVVRVGEARLRVTDPGYDPDRGAGWSGVRGTPSDVREPPAFRTNGGPPKAPGGGQAAG